MQVILKQQHKRSRCKKVFKMGIAITSLSLILGTFINAPKESYAAMQNLFTKVKEVRHTIVSLSKGQANHCG
ncbi:hypothetical protein PCURB6_00840 [Paenibacillus curdlanolyticus]|nr:hypothetical protein PCURB6_00840 [Paenibacillus curdlanolyticus]